MRLIIVIVFLGCFFLSAPSPVQGSSEIPDCMVDLGPCTSSVAGRQVEFDISPKPVRFMKELIFTVKAINKNSAPTVLLDLSMPGMYMGRNEVILNKMPDGSYRGKGIIPRCQSNRKLWRAEVTIPGAGKVSYTFNVSE